MDRWQGRVALVTGASSGIGAAICRDLIKNGLIVIGCARNTDRIESIAQDFEDDATLSGNMHAFKCDLTKESDILDMFEYIKEKFGHVDVCINNAGLSKDCPLITGSTEDWIHVFQVNVLAPCICTREAIKLMKNDNINDGHIINISSVVGHLVLNINASYYCGTKFMVRALSEGLRQELRNEKSEIRVSTISPGLVRTEFIRRMVGDEAEQQWYDKTRPLEAENISSAVITILQAPPNVDINDILIRSVQQVG